MKRRSPIEKKIILSLAVGVPILITAGYFVNNYRKENFRRNYPEGYQGIYPYREGESESDSKEILERLREYREKN